MKRDFETLNSRLIDRPLRPMFPAGWRHDTQVLNWVLSWDGERLAEPLAITAAGAAVALSEVPVPRAVAGVRVGLAPGSGEGGTPPEFLINPSRTQMQASALDLVVAGTCDGVLMLEGGGDFVPDDVMAGAVRAGASAVGEICRKVDAWAARVGKSKRTDTLDGAGSGEARAELREAMAGRLGTELAEAMAVREKKARGVALTKCQDRVKAELEDEHPGRWTDADLSAAFKDLNSRETREMARRGERSDGRAPRDVRPIASRASVLPRAHGSALFTRGETQVLATATLGDKYSALKVEDLESCKNETRERNFYLQYAFPPSSVGETGRMGAPGRREVGHGNLAERALQPVVPSDEDFPYVIRVESLVTESNGSSSMASVCGGCLAMQDAGVPIRRPVAGVAMGLVLGGADSGDSVILTDILGSEDALGDMDFKVAGDADGITAFQMDIKVEGISPELVEEALHRAREGRLHILDEMARCDPPPRRRLGGGAPVIKMTRVDPKMLGNIIGPKGANVLAIIEKFNLDDVQCNYDPKQPGLVQIVGSDEDDVDGAVAHIQASVEVPEAGKVYRGCTVKSVKDFGCFVEILPGKEALCHISELDDRRTKKVTDVCDVGDVIDVKVLEIRDNKVRVSKRAADAEANANSAPAA